eukprot:SAG11_NODE_696_length_7693_cov_9.962339_5_plen_69_part_00
MRSDGMFAQAYAQSNQAAMHAYAGGAMTEEQLYYEQMRLGAAAAGGASGPQSTEDKYLSYNGARDLLS